MLKPHLPIRRISIPLLLYLLIFGPLTGWASSASISELDLDDADPVEFSSRIMQADYEKAMLVVAENEVLIVDTVIGGQPLQTDLINSEEENILLEELGPGQTVLVQGLKLDDGRIVAIRVQLIAELPLKVESVRDFKPVE